MSILITKAGLPEFICKCSSTLTVVQRQWKKTPNNFITYTLKNLCFSIILHTTHSTDTESESELEVNISRVVFIQHLLQQPHTKQVRRLKVAKRARCALMSFSVASAARANIQLKLRQNWAILLKGGWFRRETVLSRESLVVSGNMSCLEGAADDFCRALMVFEALTPESERLLGEKS